MKSDKTRVMCNGISIHKAKLLAVAAIAAMQTGVCHAQTDTDTGFKGLDDLTGLTLQELQDRNTTKGEYSIDDMSKVFFIYNVKTGKFINSGSHWGTHITMKDYPLPMWTKTASDDNAVLFAQPLATGQGHYVKWVNNTSETDAGIFIDRRLNTDNDGLGYDGWFFEPVTDSSDPTVAGKNTYRIYTYNATSYTTDSEKYYLCVRGNVVDQDKNCEAETYADIKAKYPGYDTWRIFSMEQIYDLQEKNLDDMTNSLELSYKLKCPGFSRGNTEISNWYTYTWGKSDNACVRFGLEHLNDQPTTTVGGTVQSVTRNDGKYTHETLTSDYKFTHGDNANTATSFSDAFDYQRYMGKYFCVDAKEVRGAIYQDITVSHSGTYVIECKAYSTTPKAKLFAGLVDPANSKNTLQETLRQTVLSQVSYMPETEQAALHTSEQNMDYAGKEFYGSRKYINSVIVRVPENVANDNRVIRFGIMIGDTDDTTPEAGEWTVFDDFRLLYANKVTDEDLILDEDRADLEYLKYSTNYKNKTLHLNKTFTKDKWNSFVLPVDLTIDQFRQAFGANARIAELARLSNNEIQFESKTLDDDKTETGNGNKIAIEAYKPYIIFPTKDLSQEKTPVYTAYLTQTEGVSEKHAVVIRANHLDIPNVSFKTDAANNDNDLSNIDQDTWTSKLTTAGDGTITAYATFARTFGTATQDMNTGVYTIENKGEIISGRDNLIGCYFFDKGNLYYSDKRPRGLRGFSCWFKPAATTTSMPKLFLDGVQQSGELSEIGEITYDAESQKISQFVNGIYNMNGQLVKDGSSTAGLPKGIYIVNGKKTAVD